GADAPVGQQQVERTGGGTSAEQRPGALLGQVGQGQGGGLVGAARAGDHFAAGVEDEVQPLGALGLQLIQQDNIGKVEPDRAAKGGIVVKSILDPPLVMVAEGLLDAVLAVAAEAAARPRHGGV